MEINFLISGNFELISTFYQFSGRFGPTAVAVHPSGNLYVSHFEYKGKKNLNGRYFS